MSEGSLSASMLRLSISGPDPSQRLLKGLREGELVRLGRCPREGWAIPWDRAISREHADIRWSNGQLRVVMLPKARNPIVYRDRMVKELTIDPGDWFQIGATTFQTIGMEDSIQQEYESTINVDFGREPGSVIEEYAYSQEDLSKVAFKNSDLQLEILAQLPRIISGSHTDEDLGMLLSRLLLDAVPQSEAVAVAHFDETTLPKDKASIELFPKPLTL